MQKVWRIFISHNVRSTFYNENVFRKLLSKPKDGATTEDKNNSIMKLNVVTPK